MPGLIKIGFTTRTAEDRAKELYQKKFGVPTPFVVVHVNDCEEPEKLEGIVHNALARYRINKNREFFRYPADKAYELLKDLYENSQQRDRRLSIWRKIKKSRVFRIGQILSIFASVIQFIITVFNFIVNFFKGFLSGQH